MLTLHGAKRSDPNRALALRPFVFSAGFAAWTIFAMIAVTIEQALGQSGSHCGLLVATTILPGSVTWLLPGVWTDLYGARFVFAAQMRVTAETTFVAPVVKVASGWHGIALIRAAGRALTGVLFLLLAKHDPARVARRAKDRRAPTLIKQFAPLRYLQARHFARNRFNALSGFAGFSAGLADPLIANATGRAGGVLAHLPGLAWARCASGRRN